MAKKQEDQKESRELPSYHPHFAKKAQQEKVKPPTVSVRMRAVSEGYYDGRIIRVGEKFQYEGCLNAAGTLPYWAIPLDDVDAQGKPIVKKAAVKGAGKDAGALDAVV